MPAAHTFAQKVLSFWFGLPDEWDRASVPIPPALEARWWAGGKELDSYLREEYAVHLLAAARLFETAKRDAADALGDGEGDHNLLARLWAAARHAQENVVPEVQLPPPSSVAVAANPSGAEVEVGQVARFLLSPPPMLITAEKAREILALVILLDQFSRNIYRGTSQAFAFDRYSVPIVRQLVATHAVLLRNTLTPFERFFFLMPLEHSERDEDHRLGVELNMELLEDCRQHSSGARTATTAYFEDVVRDKSSRAVLIRQFGRYPPRNAALDRRSTMAERRYLQDRQAALAAGKHGQKDGSNFMHRLDAAPKF